MTDNNNSIELAEQKFLWIIVEIDEGLLKYGLLSGNLTNTIISSIEIIDPIFEDIAINKNVTFKRKDTIKTGQIISISKCKKTILEEICKDDNDVDEQLAAQIDDEQYIIQYNDHPTNISCVVMNRNSITWPLGELILNQNVIIQENNNYYAGKVIYRQSECADIQSVFLQYRKQCFQKYFDNFYFLEKPSQKVWLLVQRNLERNFVSYSIIDEECKDLVHDEKFHEAMLFLREGTTPVQVIILRKSYNLKELMKILNDIKNETIDFETVVSEADLSSAIESFGNFTPIIITEDSIRNLVDMDRLHYEAYANLIKQQEGMMKTDYLRTMDLLQKLSCIETKQERLLHPKSK